MFLVYGNKWECLPTFASTSVFFVPLLIKSIQCGPTHILVGWMEYSLDCKSQYCPMKVGGQKRQN